MSILWWVLVAILLVLGFLGCFINKVPGPIAVLIAAIIATTCIDVPIEWGTIGIIAGLAIVSMIASKVLVKLVKKMQEFSKRASWGTTIGSIIGLGILCAVSPESTVMVILLGVLALAVIPFVLAFLLELTNKNGAAMAVKSATSATCAFLADTCLKLVVFVYAIYVIFQF